MGSKITVITKPANRIAITKSGSNRILSVSSGISGGGVTQLANLTDVDATTPQNNETLVYDSSTGKYVVKELPVVNGGTF